MKRELLTSFHNVRKCEKERERGGGGGGEIVLNLGVLNFLVVYIKM